MVLIFDLRCVAEVKREVMGDFEDRFADSWKNYVIAAAEYKPFREVLKAEEKAYFFPSIIQGAFISVQLPSYV